MSLEVDWAQLITTCHTLSLWILHLLHWLSLPCSKWQCQRKTWNHSVHTSKKKMKICTNIIGNCMRIREYAERKEEEKGRKRKKRRRQRRKRRRRRRGADASLTITSRGKAFQNWKLGITSTPLFPLTNWTAIPIRKYAKTTNMNLKIKKGMHHKR